MDGSIVFDEILEATKVWRASGELNQELASRNWGRPRSGVGAPSTVVRGDAKFGDSAVCTVGRSRTACDVAEAGDYAGTRVAPHN